MDEKAQRAQDRRRPSRRTAIVRVMAVSLAAAAALTGGLAVQMAAGQDPALGSGHKAVATGSSFNATPPASSVTTRAS
jgi:hypothetical protein